MATYNGTNGNDTYAGTSNADTINGFAGNDTLNGAGGNDTIDPGLGIDTVNGGLGTDQLTVDYSSIGSPGNGISSGLYTSNSGYFSAYNAATLGYDQVNFSNIERFNIKGTAYDDTIITSTGNDTIDAGAGNDTITRGGGVDVVNGGDDIDILTDANFSNATTGLTIDHSGNTIQVGSHSVTNVELFGTLTTGSGNDTIAFSLRNNETINTGAGNDTINAGLGYDSVDGGDGVDQLTVDYSSIGSPGNGGIYTGLYSDTSGYFSAYNTTTTGYDQVYFSNIETLNITGTAYDDTISGGSGNDTLNGGDGNDALSDYYGGDDVFTGGAGDDTITSGTGNDTIDGGDGADTLTDADFSAATLHLSFTDDGTVQTSVTLANGDSVSGIEYFLNLNTGSGDDSINFATRRNNTINTGAGNDTINAGLGYDNVDGGDGVDQLTVDYSSTGTPENGGIYTGFYSDTSGYFFAYNNTTTGYDQVYFSNIETLNITGTAYDDGISGGSGNDTLNGGDGNDALSDYYGGSNILNGGAGDDSYNLYASISSSGTQIQDTGDTDTLNLYDIDLTLATPTVGTYGLLRSNTTLLIDINGDGDATAATDLAILNFFNASGGAGVGFIETVDNLSGTAILDAFGSTPTNTVTGTAANEKISATSLRDVIDAAGGNDQVTATVANLQQNDAIAGGLGTDTLVITGGISTDVLTLNLTNSANQLSGISGLTIASFEKFDFSKFVGTTIATGSGAKDSFISGQGNDHLSGGAGNDTLNGGTGSDTLNGGAGNDTYVIDNLGDTITDETSTGGTDSVQSSVAYTLGSFIEKLVLKGTTGISGTGNTLNNTITGNTGANTLNGDSGNDTLNGGAGNDTLNGNDGNDTLIGNKGNDVLTGDAGVDKFVFDMNATFNASAIGKDSVIDFVQGTDKLVLDKTTFKALTSAPGTLAASEFAVINEAIDGASVAGASSAKVVFNQANGEVFYNPDSTTAGLTDGGAFANLNGVAALASTDVLVQA